LLSLVALLVGGMGGAVAFGIGRAVRAVAALRDSLPTNIALIRDAPLYHKLQEHLQDTDSYLESAKHYATSAVHYLTAFGHLLVHATIGLILAVIYLLEEEERRTWARAVDPRSLIGTRVRWLGHVADAVALTIQLQLVVAGCNAVMTLP